MDLIMVLCKEICMLTFITLIYITFNSNDNISLKNLFLIIFEYISHTFFLMFYRKSFIFYFTYSILQEFDNDILIKDRAISSSTILIYIEFTLYCCISLTNLIIKFVPYIFIYCNKFSIVILLILKFYYNQLTKFKIGFD